MGLLFVIHGVIFVVQPAIARDRMSDGPLSLPQLRMLGVAELSGGAVVLASTLVRLPALLVRAASSGIVGVLVPATLLHLRRRELAEAIGTAIGAGVAASLICPDGSDVVAQRNRSDNG